MLFDASYAGLQNVLDLRSQQHALTATNLANADTPGFRARVIDFEHELSAAYGDDGRLQVQRTDARHIGTGAAAGNPAILELEPMDGTLDGNSVNVEREMVRLGENQMLFSAVSRGLSRRLAMLKFAANDGR
ncbi:MAG: flagellar basal body rod protein FlgB [Myxococcales bacterium]|nr:flagellar basal body rod protein FlgB [Myxococcales bacterium]MCA9566247.1 flagellar basal body rod protein FlgB [Myxococcales bacterium]MCB9690959.1 flagellar basal body rod protein FlgB [Alphaproteobacteria bacterium]